MDIQTRPDPVGRARELGAEIAAAAASGGCAACARSRRSTVNMVGHVRHRPGPRPFPIDHEIPSDDAGDALTLGAFKPRPPWYQAEALAAPDVD